MLDCKAPPSHTASTSPVQCEKACSSSAAATTFTHVPSSTEICTVWKGAPPLKLTVPEVPAEPEIVTSAPYADSTPANIPARTPAAPCRMLVIVFSPFVDISNRYNAVHFQRAYHPTFHFVKYGPGARSTHAALGAAGLAIATWASDHAVSFPFSFTATAGAPRGTARDSGGSPRRGGR